MQFDPFLDEITRRPTATFALYLTNPQAGDARDKVLHRVAKTAGVLIFFRFDCPYCEAQAPLLKLLESRYGFSVLPVSIDGSPLSGGAFPNFRSRIVLLTGENNVGAASITAALPGFVRWKVAGKPSGWRDYRGDTGDAGSAFFRFRLQANDSLEKSRWPAGWLHGDAATTFRPPSRREAE